MTGRVPRIPVPARARACAKVAQARRVTSAGSSGAVDDREHAIHRRHERSIIGQRAETARPITPWLRSGQRRSARGGESLSSAPCSATSALLAVTTAVPRESNVPRAFAPVPRRRALRSPRRSCRARSGRIRVMRPGFGQWRSLATSRTSACRPETGCRRGRWPRDRMPAAQRRIDAGQRPASPMRMSTNCTLLHGLRGPHAQRPMMLRFGYRLDGHTVLSPLPGRELAPGAQGPRRTRVQPGCCGVAGPGPCHSRYAVRRWSAEVESMYFDAMILVRALTFARRASARRLFRSSSFERSFPVGKDNRADEMARWSFPAPGSRRIGRRYLSAVNRHRCHSLRVPARAWRHVRRDHR